MTSEMHVSPGDFPGYTDLIVKVIIFVSTGTLKSMYCGIIASVNESS
jgi:hypothetical protein